MSVRGRKILLQLLNRVINPDTTFRNRLRGGLDHKSAAIKAAVDLLAWVRLGGCGRVWERKRRDIDIFIKEQRQLADNCKLGPGLRVDALRRLTVLEGYSSPAILSDDAADQYTKKLIASSSTSVNVYDVSDFLAQLTKSRVEELKLETAADILRRLNVE